MINPYAQLASDPTSQIYISWIDEGSNLGATQTLEYREVGKPDYTNVTDNGVAIPNGGGNYKYEVFLTTLTPNTEYEGNIKTGEDTVAIRFKTLPTRLWRTEVKVFLLSDIHIDDRTPGGMQNGSEMLEVNALTPDVLVINGDIVTWGYEGNPSGNTMTTTASEWVDFFSEHINALNGENNYLVPIIISPGNHEVGNRFFTGSGSTSPSAGFVQFFFSNVKDIEPVGKNYGKFSFGNYLDILCLDSHSAETSEVKEWVQNNLTDDTHTTITFQHNPMFPAGSRVSEDLTLSENMRNDYGRLLLKSPTVKVCFGGHLHVNKTTKALTTVSSEPSGSDFFSLGDGDYVVSAQEGDTALVEYGEGYRNNLNFISGSLWYLDTSLEDDDTYNVGYLLTLNKDNLRVETWRFRDDFVKDEAYVSERILYKNPFALTGGV
jgi:hypothetical protein